MSVNTCQRIDKPELAMSLFELWWVVISWKLGHFLSFNKKPGVGKLVLIVLIIVMVYGIEKDIAQLNHIYGCGIQQIKRVGCIRSQ